MLIMLPLHASRLSQRTISTPQCCPGEHVTVKFALAQQPSKLQLISSMLVNVCVLPGVFAVYTYLRMHGLCKIMISFNFAVKLHTIFKPVGQRMV